MNRAAPMDKVNLFVTDPAGVRHHIVVRAGTSLMRAVAGNDIAGIAADCGGCLNCATCHVYVHERWLDRLPARSEAEVAMLELTAAERRPSSRLSCQIELGPALDGLEALLPETQY